MKKKFCSTNYIKDYIKFIVIVPLLLKVSLLALLVNIVYYDIKKEVFSRRFHFVIFLFLFFEKIEKKFDTVYMKTLSNMNVNPALISYIALLFRHITLRLASIVTYNIHT